MNFAIYKMGEWNEFIIEVLEDMFPSCLYEGKSVSFLIIESFFANSQVIVFKTVIMLRSLTGNLEQSPLFSALLQWAIVCAQPRVREHKTPPNTGTTFPIRGEPVSSYWGLQAREGSERPARSPLPASIRTVLCAHTCLCTTALPNTLLSLPCSGRLFWRCT